MLRTFPIAYVYVWCEKTCLCKVIGAKSAKDSLQWQNLPLVVVGRQNLPLMLEGEQHLTLMVVGRQHLPLLVEGGQHLSLMVEGGIICP